MKRNESFNTIAELYDQMRPSYDPKVIDWIVSKAGVRAGDMLLEVGPGTGQATIPFAERGFKIRGVELGAHMANLLKKKCESLPNVTIDISPFEEWKPEAPTTFQMIYYASAFHWIDKEIKYKKCAELLADSGYLVLMWHDYPDEDFEMFTHAYELLDQFLPKEQKLQYQTRAEKIQKRVDEINQSGYFTFSELFEYNWILEESSEEFLRGFKTQSSYIALEESAKEALSAELEKLIQKYDSQIQKKYITTVYLAQKVDRD